MPLPNDEEFDIDCVAIAENVRIPDGWTLHYEVKPFLGYDLGYEVDKKHHVISITAYSARYPSTLYDWIRSLADEIHQKTGW